MKRGFTLIELIVVVIIIGLLAAIALPRYIDVVNKAKEAEGWSILSSVRTAVQRYYMVNNAVPALESELDVTFTARKYCTGDVSISTNNVSILCPGNKTLETNWR